MSDGKQEKTDPTVLTTEALHREIKNVFDTLRGEMQGDNELNDERFRGIDKRFDLVEKLRVEQKQDTEKAVQAALTAQKDAVREQTQSSSLAINKSEMNMTGQMSQQYATITAELRAATDKITDLAARVTVIEATKLGGAEQRGQNKDLWGYLVGAAGIAFALAKYINP